MDAPVQTSDGKKSTAALSNLLCISNDDAKSPKQGNQDGWGPVQYLNGTELVSHCLTNEQQHFDDDYGNPNRSSGELKERHLAHRFVTEMGKRLESKSPSSSPEG
jgi:hypothetical protein